MCNLYLVIFLFHCAIVTNAIIFTVTRWKQRQSNHLLLRADQMHFFSGRCDTCHQTVFFHCMHFFYQELHQSSSYANWETKKKIFVFAGTTVDFVCWISRVKIWSNHHHHYWPANAFQPINNASWFLDQTQKCARLQWPLVSLDSKSIRCDPLRGMTRKQQILIHINAHLVD